MKIISWNLYYRSGAAAADIADLIEQERPDLFLMQEVTPQIEALPGHAGGHFYKLPWRGKRYGLAAWAPEPLEMKAIPLPFSRMPGKFPPRQAQIISRNDLTIANVHLSHGQMLNRKQLWTVADAIAGPLAIIGDYNAVGPVVMRGFKDVGPRGVTHRAQRLVPFRLDRCLVRNLRCERAETLDKGASDHRPILLELTADKLTRPRTRLAAST